eukprot:CAMPEP_0182612634 /NCGR_PEP_ID=MMETSP1330-20130603/19858_1 /TAXON_ID=464278 /ORGANISM="Picochlorum sp., Strain RCC944" /LENGTH=179 /DNA_ID=CAMNT_0024832203 /DNA_START=53 /DNA_END=589 /DNA_ORIENTATION=+
MASRRGARPTGTDGSDHQYRMVIESKYQKVADKKKRLRTVLALQALYYGCFIAWNCGVPLIEGKRPAPVVGVMPLVGFLALILGRKGVGMGNERSSVTALWGYAFCSFVGTALAMGNAFIMQTMVHYENSYPTRFGSAMQTSFGLDKHLVQAFAQILEGCIHAAGFMLQGVGAYLAVSL